MNQHILSTTPMYLAQAQKAGFKGIGQAMSRALRTGGKVAAFGALAPLGTMALFSLMEAKDKAGEAATRGGDFKNMLEEAPSLKENQSRAKKHFMTLRRLAPDISKDPVLSAGYVRKVQTYENQGVDPSLVAPLLLRDPSPGMKTMKKWEVASQTLPQTKVGVETWEL